MISYIVIGICILLLLAVIFISAKPISMGIEARRDINTSSKPEKDDEEEFENLNDKKVNNISEEILKLSKLKDDGIISDEEYKKAKEKLLN